MYMYMCFVTGSDAILYAFNSFFQMAVKLSNGLAEIYNGR